MECCHFILKQVIERLQNITMYDLTHLFLELTALLIFWLHTPGGMDDRPVEASAIRYYTNAGRSWSAVIG